MPSEMSSASSMISNHYCNLLKVCCLTLNLPGAKATHAHLLRTQPHPETFLLNHLITTYGKLHHPLYARHVFDLIPHPTLFSHNSLLSSLSKSSLPHLLSFFSSIPKRDAVSWATLISAFSSRAMVTHAAEAYTSSLKECSSNLTRITLSTMLIMCSNTQCFDLAVQIHAHVVTFGFEGYAFVASPLIDMYAKCDRIVEARRVLDGTSERNVVMCNTLVTGLMRMGKVREAEGLFGEMGERDSVSWTAMISGMTRNGEAGKALEIFREMRWCGFAMDQFTFGSVLTACGGMMAGREGKEVHGFVVRTGFVENVFVSSALVDMYCKCGSVGAADKVFRSMKGKNVVSWTALLVGYGQNGYSEEAVRVFCDMQRSGVEPDEYTLGSLISSCANLASLEEGAQFHCQALVTGLSAYTTVSNALVTLYGKCGSIEDSHRLFDEMSIRDEVSWSALVSGYARFGKANETIDLFERMLAQGLKPDGVTFIGVLSACSRAGLVEKGHQYFESMTKVHGITPLVDHYTCIIDLLSRAGRLEEARTFISKMPMRPDAIGWATLLSSCRFRSNLEIGNWAAKSLREIDPQNPASYVLLSSIYAAKGKWDEVSKLRTGMRDKGIRKEPGCSWIKYKSKVHIFSADDQTSPFSDQIYAELENLYPKMLAEGYQPDVSSILHDVDELQKMKMLNYHSERLAIAFGLIFIPSGLPIRVVKNLRVCGDCHNATKYISKITKREILVRDAVRYHLFKDGTCSCGDFW